MTAAQPMVSLYLRVPPGLKAELAAQAAKMGVSVNALCVAYLEGVTDKR